ncbi:hypothetical protein E4U16_005095 [Claviceps sp. LM84 group G4]|nr:hypothetical protein E4U16_005095 [Claviceps sp. LM84 group G4]
MDGVRPPTAERLNLCSAQSCLVCVLCRVVTEAMTGDAQGRQPDRRKAAAEGREQVIAFERAGEKVRSGLDSPEQG